MKRYVALDTETTGKADDGTTGDHRIIEVGCVEIIDRKITGRTVNLRVNPERHVDEEAQRVHGISDEMLKDKPVFAAVASEIVDFIRGSELLIHNAKFDTAFLDMEWARAGINEKTSDMAHVVDTVSLAMKLCPGHQVNLDNLCKIYDVDTSARTVHGALLDAMLLAEVYLAMTGGQSSLTFGSAASAKKSAGRWERPEGVSLPVMGVERESHAVHMAQILELAQNHLVAPGENGAPDIGGSDWGPEYRIEMLKITEEEAKTKEGKEQFAARRQAKLEETEQRLMGDDFSLYKSYKEKLKADYTEWENRVLGK